MPPGNQQQQYDFIMSGGQKVKKPGFSLPTGNSQGQRIAIFAGILVVLLLFFFFIVSIASGGGESKTNYINLVQQQSELIRVAGLGSVDTSTSQNVKNAAASTQTALSSDKQILVAAMQEKGIKLKEQQLAGTPNTTTDNQLAAAKAAANYDSTILKILTQQLTAYRAQLQTTYDQTKSKSLKTSLSQIYEHSNLLQKQLETTKP